MKLHGLVVWASLILVYGCLDDEDRCADGLIYDSETRVCLKFTDTDTDTGMDELDASTEDQDGGPSDDTEDSRPSGLGESCTVTGDCLKYKEDYCFYSENSGSGYCTVQNCSFGACPAGYMCCDCSTSSLFPIDILVCLNEEQGSLASSVAGCTCE